MNVRGMGSSVGRITLAMVSALVMVSGCSAGASDDTGGNAVSLQATGERAPRRGAACPRQHSAHRRPQRPSLGHPYV